MPTKYSRENRNRVPFGPLTDEDMIAAIDKQKGKITTKVKKELNVEPDDKKFESSVSPSRTLLKRFGFNLPEGSPNRGEVISDEQVEKEHEKIPAWRRTAGKYLIDAPVGLTKGLIGIDPERDKEGNWKNDVGANFNKLGQFLSAGEGLRAGMPFLKLNKGKPMFHGRKKDYEMFNPELHDKNDTLGWATHGAQRADYANTGYAMGGMKSTGGGNQPNIIPVHPEAKNVLDLHEPNMDDLSQMTASLPKAEKDEIVKQYRQDRGTPAVARKKLVENLERKLNKPINLKNSPFDAIKYSDIGHPSFAVPETTQMRTPWGTPLNTPPRDIKVHRMDERSTAFKTGADRPSSLIVADSSPSTARVKQTSAGYPYSNETLKPPVSPYWGKKLKITNKSGDSFDVDIVHDLDVKELQYDLDKGSKIDIIGDAGPNTIKLGQTPGGKIETDLDKLVKKEYADKQKSILDMTDEEFAAHMKKQFPEQQHEPYILPTTEKTHPPIAPGTKTAEEAGFNIGDQISVKHKDGYTYTSVLNPENKAHFEKNLLSNPEYEITKGKMAGPDYAGTTHPIIENYKAGKVKSIGEMTDKEFGEHIDGILKPGPTKYKEPKFKETSEPPLKQMEFNPDGTRKKAQPWGEHDRPPVTQETINNLYKDGSITTQQKKQLESKISKSKFDPAYDSGKLKSNFHSHTGKSEWENIDYPDETTFKNWEMDTDPEHGDYFKPKKSGEVLQEPNYTTQEISEMYISGKIDADEYHKLIAKTPEAQAPHSYTSAKSELGPDEADFGKDLGILSKKDAGYMAQAGELSWAKYDKAFGDKHVDIGPSTDPLDLSHPQWDKLDKSNDSYKPQAAEIAAQKLQDEQMAQYYDNVAGNKPAPLKKPSTFGSSYDEALAKVPPPDYEKLYGDQFPKDAQGFSEPIPVELNDEQMASFFEPEPLQADSYDPTPLKKQESEIPKGWGAIEGYPPIPTEQPSKILSPDYVPKGYGAVPKGYGESAYKNLGSAGGSHGATILQDAYGTKTVFKPMHHKGEVPAMAEEFGSKIANSINQQTPIVSRVDLPQFGAGVSQPFIENTKTIRSMDDIRPEHVPDFTQEHAIDWLIGNHDSHFDQFLSPNQGGHMIPVDKGQAWKHWQDERLHPAYHPNEKYGARPPVYSQMSHMVDYDQAMDTAKHITDYKSHDVMGLAEEFARLKFGPDHPDFGLFMKHMEDKLKNLPTDIGKYWMANSPF